MTAWIKDTSKIYLFESYVPWIFTLLASCCHYKHTPWTFCV